MRHQILISVGSNIDKITNTRDGLQALHDCIGELEISTIYESESVGFSGNNFYNLVAKTHTQMPISQVCECLKTIENEHGRIRDKKFGNRTLDLDLLTYGQTVCSEPVVLPRPEIEYNAFVLKPMAEIAASDVHPTTGDTYANMWKNYNNNKQRLWPSDMQWSPKNP